MSEKEADSASRVTRRLAAIMFTDIVGYTSLSQRNEPLALAILEEHRSIIRPLLASHRGIEIKTIGDAFLVSFSNTLDALDCASRIQETLHARNSEVTLDNKILIRIGIHLGDVIETNGDVYGDTVNVASRIHALAMPGGICLTQQVFDQVRNKTVISIVPTGKYELKNVESPVEIYAVALPWESPQVSVLKDKAPDLQVQTDLVTKVATGVKALDELLRGGYPQRTSVMINGPSGVGKEALGYWFLHLGLVQGDYCLYVTHRSVNDVLRNMQAYGIRSNLVPQFVASSGSEKRCNLRDAASISSEIKLAIETCRGRRIRIVTDILSPLLIMNSPESMYSYWTQLIDEIKNYDAVIIAYVEEAMHQPMAFASMEQLFDNVIDLKIYEQGLMLTPLLRIKKMQGLPPLHGYFKASFSKTGMEIVANVSR